MWILRGSSAPDHNTVARFISSCKIEIEDLFYQLINKLIELNEIDLENVFIDSTKIEANANKYTFVWKKAVNKFYEKLKIKVNDFWHSFNENNSTEFNDIYEIEKHLEKEILDKNIEFVYGKGVRKTQQQRDYETVTSYITKENEYNILINKQYESFVNYKMEPKILNFFRNSSFFSESLFVISTL